MPQALLARPSSTFKIILLSCFVALAVIVPIGDAEANSRHPRITQAVKIARAQIGDPYVYGANGPNAFDCSGLTSFSYKRAGRYLPRTSDAQWRYTRHIRKSNISKGDLMFFLNGGDVYHAGIFVGRKNGRAMILHASRSGNPVKIDPVWTNNWRAGTVRHRR